jgi:hypothetical protein
MLARLRVLERSGALYLGLGAASAAGAGLLYTASQREARQWRELGSEFDAAAAAAMRQHGNDREARNAEDRGRPVLWSGVITATMPGCDGPAMLAGARNGARVEVLQEDVGDRGAYVRCREPGGTSGLYLRQWIAKDGDRPGSGRAGG